MAQNTVGEENRNGGREGGGQNRSKFVDLAKQVGNQLNQEGGHRGIVGIRLPVGGWKPARTIGKHLSGKECKARFKTNISLVPDTHDKQQQAYQAC